MKTTQQPGNVSPPLCGEIADLNRLRVMACEVRREHHREFDDAARAYIQRQRLQVHYREADARVIKEMTDGSAAGNVIDNDRYNTRFRLDSFKYNDLVMDRNRHVHDDYRVCPNCGDVAELCEDTHRFKHSHRKHAPTVVPEDILPISRLDMKLMRYNHPEAYEAYVDALRHEMGAHFDESLIL